MKKIDDEILIRDYHNHILDEDGVKQYEELYETNPDFKNLADRIEVEMLGIREYSRQQLKTKFSAWEKEDSVSNQDKANYNWFIGIAASILLVTGAVLFWPNSQSSDELFLSYYEPYENFEYTATRNESDDSLDLKAQAFKSYDEGNHKLAIELFTRLHNEDPEKIAYLFFRAASRIELKLYDDSLVDLNKVVESNDPYYSEDARWYLSLIYIRLDKLKQAKSELKLLVRSETYGDRAQTILEEL